MLGLPNIRSLYKALIYIHTELILQSNAISIIEMALLEGDCMLTSRNVPISGYVCLQQRQLLYFMIWFKDRVGRLGRALPRTHFYFYFFLFYNNFTYMSNMFFQLLAWESMG